MVAIRVNASTCGIFLPLVAFAVFGSSRQLVVAAEPATAAILSSSVSNMAAPGSEQYVLLVGMVALLTAGLLRLHRGDEHRRHHCRRPVGRHVGRRDLDVL
jgi:hypothetical protein